MVFLSLRAFEGPLFPDHAAAGALWRRFAACGPFDALCLLPDRVLLLAATLPALGNVLSAWVRWRHHAFGLAPPRWLREELDLTEAQLRPALRRIHLAPVAAGLVADPLAWAWSTHRDRAGLSLDALAPREAAPELFDAWVRAPALRPFPRARGQPSLEEILAAACNLGRCPPGRTALRGRLRLLAWRAARAVGHRDSAEVAAVVGGHRRSVQRAWAGRADGPALATLLRVTGDPRFSQPLAGPFPCAPVQAASQPAEVRPIHALRRAR